MNRRQLLAMASAVRTARLLCTDEEAERARERAGA